MVPVGGWPKLYVAIVLQKATEKLEDWVAKAV